MGCGSRRQNRFGPSAARVFVKRWDAFRAGLEKKKISYHQQSRAEELIIVSSLSVCADEAEQEACTIPSQKH